MSLYKDFLLCHTEKQINTPNCNDICPVIYMGFFATTFTNRLSQQLSMAGCALCLMPKASLTRKAVELGYSTIYNH